MQLIERFLNHRGVTLDGLMDEVESSYGKVLLVVATGSVVAGLGNPSSDVDLMVVVDRDAVSRMPIMSYKGKTKVDAEYYFADALKKQIDLVLHDAPYASIALTPENWASYFVSVQIATRLAIGQPLKGNPDWLALLDTLKTDVFYARIARWWLVEALRGLVGARMLREQDPIAACLLYCDAIMSLLSSRVAEKGMMLLSKKWIGEKLKLLGDEAGLALYHQALMLPHDGIDRAKEACQRFDTALCASPALLTLAMCAQVHLWLAKGVSINAFQDVTLVKKHLRGVSFPAHSTLAVQRPEKPIWRGSVNETPDPDMASLLPIGFAWVGLHIDE